MSQKPSPLRPVPTRSPDYIISEIRRVEQKAEELRQWIRGGCQDDQFNTKAHGFAAGIADIQLDLIQIRSWCEATGPTSWWREGARERLKKSPLLD